MVRSSGFSSGTYGSGAIEPSWNRFHSAASPSDQSVAAGSSRPRYQDASGATGQRSDALRLISQTTTSIMAQAGTKLAQLPLTRKPPSASSCAVPAGPYSQSLIAISPAFHSISQGPTVRTRWIAFCTAGGNCQPLAGH